MSKFEVIEFKPLPPTKLFEGDRYEVIRYLRSREGWATLSIRDVENNSYQSIEEFTQNWKELDKTQNSKIYEDVFSAVDSFLDKVYQGGEFVNRSSHSQSEELTDEIMSILRSGSEVIEEPVERPEWYETQVALNSFMKKHTTLLVRVRGVGEKVDSLIRSFTDELVGIQRVMGTEKINVLSIDHLVEKTAHEFRDTVRSGELNLDSPAVDEAIEKLTTKYAPTIHTLKKEL